MKVLKFGGSAITDLCSIDRFCDVVENSVKNNIETAIIVSAFSNITKLLQSTIELAVAGDMKYRLLYFIIAKRHSFYLNTVITKFHLADDENSSVLFEDKLLGLLDILDSVFLLRNCPPATKDKILSFGERCAAFVMSRCIKMIKNINTVYIDTRKLIITNNDFGNAQIDTESTKKNIVNFIKTLRERNNIVPIITGFIGATACGETTTFGRNGSDYTAAIFASFFNAKYLEIWQNTDGICSADPKIVNDAVSLEYITCEHMFELAYFSSEILHAKSISYAKDNNITILVKNIHNPQHVGTIICNKQNAHSGCITFKKHVITISITAKLCNNAAVIHTGILEKLIAIAEQHNIKLLLMTKSSSCRSIAVVISKEDSVIFLEKLHFKSDNKKHLSTIVVAVKRKQSLVVVCGVDCYALFCKYIAKLDNEDIQIYFTEYQEQDEKLMLVVDESCAQKVVHALHDVLLQSYPE